MIDIDWDLLFRYLGTECTAEERERFERWLAADPTHHAFLDAAVIAAGRTLDQGAMSASQTLRVVAPRPAAARSWTTWPLTAAASLLIVLGGALVWRFVGPSGSGAPNVAAALQVATTGRGARQTLRLRDGTRVVLGASSTLRYPADFTGGSRDVFLTGEGYFEVTHDAKHPFRVHAGGATAEDLGTAFGVRAYTEDAAVRVVVVEGMVALGATTPGAVHGAVLTRGQLGRLTKGSAVTAVRNVDVDAYLGWTKGRLAFDETPLPEVVAELGRWYDAEFRIADSSLISRRLTGSFTTESLDEVLTVLGPALDVRLERVADTVIVHPPKRRR
jgi:transmembrane sensor